MRPLIPIVAAAAAALSACAVGPDYRAPDTAPAVLAGAAAPDFSHAAFESAWWARFGDPALDALVARALEQNRELALAVARVREARALFAEAQLDRLPHVTSGAGYSHGKAQAPTGGPRLEAESYSLGLDLAWEVDLFGRARRVAEGAQAQAAAADADLRAAQVAVIAEVVRNYFELRGAGQRLAVARQNRDKTGETLRLTELRLREGAGSEIDVASSRARLAAVEALIPQLEVAEKSVRHRLAVLLGERPGAIDAQALVARGAPIAQELPIGDPAELLRRRPDVAAAERRLAAATAGVGVATADFFPRVSVAGFVGFFGGQGSALLESGAQAWSIAPGIRWPLLDLGTTRARLRVADARAEAALAAYEQAVLLALEETENALARYAGARKRLASLIEQSAAARRAAELAQVRFREGASDFLVLLDAERTRLDAEDAVAAGETAVNTAAVAVYRALGGGWDAPATRLVATSG